MSPNPTSKDYLKHLLYIILIYVAIIWIVLRWVNSYTQHDITVAVPNLNGKTIKEVKEIVNTNNLEYHIADSIYNTDLKKGTVVEQNPAPGIKVKQSRTVYITVNAFKPPMVKMPNLIDVSLRQAKAILETFGLQVGNLKYEPDFAKDAVLKQIYKGSIIAPGAPIVQESRIDLVLGDGLKSEKTELPYVIGLTRKVAISKIKEHSLNIGTEVFDKTVKDTAKAIVYKQFPKFNLNEKVNLGSPVDLFFTNDMSKITKADDDSIDVNNKSKKTNEE